MAGLQAQDFVQVLECGIDTAVLRPRPGPLHEADHFLGPKPDGFREVFFGVF